MDETTARATKLLLEKTSAFTGTAYLDALTRAAIDAIGATCAFVAKVDHDGNELVTLACSPRDTCAPKTVHGTPLDELVRHGVAVSRHAGEEWWPTMRDAFVALPTLGRDERLRGLVVVTGPTLDRARVTSVLAPFAVRVAAELERIAEDELRRAREARAFEGQRLERVASLAGGVAHDFNNVLVGILGNVELALLRAGDDSRIRPHLEAIQRSSLRAADLTRQLLTYAGKTRYEVQPLKMDEVLLELRGLFAASADEHARLEYEIAPGLPSVLADRSKVSQLFVALVANAAEAIAANEADGGTIRVIAKRGERFESTAGFRPEPPDPSRSYVEIAIADDGPGMTAETRARLFEPFFSTKAASGRGLGLAASLGIVIAHEGRIAIESTEGAGTTVRVLLPTAESRPPSTPRPPRRSDPVAHTSSDAHPSPLPPRPESSARTFLVVDDDPTVREIARVILETGGFSVEVAHDGASAIAAFDAASKSIAGLVLDLRMPKIRGVEVLRHVRRTHPTLPVVIITAYPDELESLPKDRFVRVVPKPFVAGEILDAVQDLMHRDAR